MVLMTSSKPQRLLYLSYVQRVSPAELAGAREELKGLLAELPEGFRLLADLSQVEFMDPECVTELGWAMDLMGRRTVSVIVRIIPDASKDIGLNILSIFHYPHHPRIITCQTLAMALHQLSLYP